MLITGFKLKASFPNSRAQHIVIVTRPPTVHGRDLNPGLLSLEESILTELLRPANVVFFNFKKRCLFQANKNISLVQGIKF